MQLYCNNFLCNYMQLCNMQLMQLKQLYGTYATLCNFMKLYATLCNNATYATICNYMQHMQLCNYMKLMELCNYMTDRWQFQLYATICNYMIDRCGNFNFMQLNETICNCVGTKNIYWHDNLSSFFNECRYHQIAICQIYLPQVMINI
jgi:hypothetical protein